MPRTVLYPKPSSVVVLVFDNFVWHLISCNALTSLSSFCIYLVVGFVTGIVVSSLADVCDDY